MTPLAPACVASNRITATRFVSGQRTSRLPVKRRCVLKKMTSVGIQARTKAIPKISNNVIMAFSPCDIRVPRRDQHKAAPSRLPDADASLPYLDRPRRMARNRCMADLDFSPALEASGGPAGAQDRQEFAANRAPG